jgi:hypothetical protein
MGAILAGDWMGQDSNLTTQKLLSMVEMEKSVQQQP